LVEVSARCWKDADVSADEVLLLPEGAAAAVVPGRRGWSRGGGIARVHLVDSGFVAAVQYHGTRCKSRITATDVRLDAVVEQLGERIDALRTLDNHDILAGVSNAVLVLVESAGLIFGYLEG
jgi:hypothetical protein